MKTLLTISLTIWASTSCKIDADCPHDDVCCIGRVIGEGGEQTICVSPDVCHQGQFTKYPNNVGLILLGQCPVGRGLGRCDKDMSEEDYNSIYLTSSASWTKTTSEPPGVEATSAAHRRRYKWH